MKKLLYSILFGLLIRLIRKVKKPSIINSIPTFTTVGQEYAPPPDAATAEEKRDHFNAWCKYTGVSKQYTPDPDLKSASTVVILKNN